MHEVGSCVWQRDLLRKRGLTGVLKASDGDDNSDNGY